MTKSSLGNTNYHCPIALEDITGVMQWTDGFPFNAYGRASHTDPNWGEVDINAYYSSPVFSPVDGKVDLVGKNQWARTSGDSVIGIIGDDGLYYRLVHVYGIKVAEGQRVSAGQEIAQMVSSAEVNSEGLICNLSQDSTAKECIKVHLHFERYVGYREDHSSPSTTQFVADHCNLVRPADDTNPEFPSLPTINCARIHGNNNIHRCFAEKPVCVPDCSEKQCGDDGCGNTCGSCTESKTCNNSGQCIEIQPSKTYNFVAGWNYMALPNNSPSISTSEFLQRVNSQKQDNYILSIWNTTLSSFTSISIDNSDIYGRDNQLSKSTPFFFRAPAEFKFKYKHSKDTSTSEITLSDGWNSTVFNSVSSKTPIDFIKTELSAYTTESYSKVYISKFESSKQVWKTYIYDAGREYGDQFEIEEDTPYFIFLGFSET